MGAYEKLKKALKGPKKSIQLVIVVTAPKELVERVTASNRTEDDALYYIMGSKESCSGLISFEEIGT